MINITCHTSNGTQKYTFVDLQTAVYAFSELLLNAYTHYNKVVLFPYTAASLVNNLNIALYNISPCFVDTTYTLD